MLCFLDNTFNRKTLWRVKVEGSPNTVKGFLHYKEGERGAELGGGDVTLYISSSPSQA